MRSMLEDSFVSVWSIQFAEVSVSGGPPSTALVYRSNNDTIIATINLWPQPHSTRVNDNAPQCYIKAP